jgi:hypothetical protein
VFAHVENGFHGHTQPLACPEDRRRKSLSVNLYSSAFADEESRKFKKAVFFND